MGQVREPRRAGEIAGRWVHWSTCWRWLVGWLTVRECGRAHERLCVPMPLGWQGSPNHSVTNAPCVAAGMVNPVSFEGKTLVMSLLV